MIWYCTEKKLMIVRAEKIVEYLNKHIFYFYRDCISNLYLKTKYKLIFIIFDIYNGEITFSFIIKHYIFGLTYPRFRLKNISLFTLMLQEP